MFVYYIIAVNECRLYKPSHNALLRTPIVGFQPNVGGEEYISRYCKFVISGSIVRSVEEIGRYEREARLSQTVEVTYTSVQYPLGPNKVIITQ